MARAADKPPETEEQRRERVARISRQMEEFLNQEAAQRRTRLESAT
jgi:hypothetical protein